MQHSEGTCQVQDGNELYTQSWKPEKDPVADVVIVHGFGEHSARYAHVATALVNIGCAVYALDLHGHGHSPGKRGDIESWDVYREDVDALLRSVVAGNNGRKTFLYGHSMGGLVAIDYILHGENGVSGLIASGPLLAQAGVSPVMVSISRILAKILPSISINVGLDSSMISRDPEVVKAYQNDPLVHGLATPRFGVELENAIAWCQAHAGDLTLPFLLVYGEEDRLVPPEGSQNFYEHIQSEDRSVFTVRGGYHEPHNDLDQAAVLAEITGWLNCHL